MRSMVLMTPEELEIKQFYDEGMSISDIAECTGHKKYRIKKLLEYRGLFIFRHLREAIPDCQIKKN